MKHCKSVDFFQFL